MKTQIWIAVSVYVLVAIVRKRLLLSISLYQILQPPDSQDDSWRNVKAAVKRHRPQTGAGSPSGLSSPVSFRKIASFGLFFLVVQLLATLGQRWFG